MTNLEAYIQDSFARRMDVLRQAQETLAPSIARACHVLSDCLRQGGKILVCGNGGSAADAQHFATELVVQYMSLRKALPAIALTTDTSILTAAANDFGFASVFARQIEALGRRSDVLIAISTSGNSPNILQACAAASGQGLGLIVLTGQSGGKLAAQFPNAVCIHAPSQTTSQIQEIHCMVLHLFCDLLEKELALGPIS